MNQPYERIRAMRNYAVRGVEEELKNLLDRADFPDHNTAVHALDVVNLIPHRDPHFPMRRDREHLLREAVAWRQVAARALRAAVEMVLMAYEDQDERLGDEAYHALEHGRSPETGAGQAMTPTASQEVGIDAEQVKRSRLETPPF